MIEMLILPHYNTTECIEIAKGKHKIPKTLKEGIKQLIREWKRNK